MNELSKQAFDTDNFDLAAEILERSLVEEGPSTERYLCLGDSYARGGHLEKAFVAYSSSIQHGRVSPSRLHHLVASLVDTMAQRDETVVLKNLSKADIFACVICKSFWTEPVSLQCGHTFCRACLQKNEPSNCKTCGLSYKQERISLIKTNVLLVQTLEKWFPRELEAIQLKSIGSKCFAEERYLDAVGLFTEALSRVPSDHLLTSNRSAAYACLEQYDEALNDAELTISLQPDWPKGYYRKGVALSGLGEHEQAAYAYLQCLTLDQGVQTARAALAKSLHKILSPIEAEEHFRRSNSRPAYFQHAVTSLPQSPLSSLSAKSLEELKSSLHDSLAKTRPSKSSAEASEQKQETKSDVMSHLLNVDAVAATSSSFATFTVTDSYHHNLAKSNSLPSSSNSSPVLPRQRELKRCPSDQDVRRESGSRKRSNQDKIEPMSPTRCSTPIKLARPDNDIKYRKVSAELLDKDDFECSLCMRLLHMPVTTPCGHAFCRQCLDRVLDHSPQCPLCKSSLVEYLAERRTSVTEAIDSIIRVYFLKDYEERKVQHEEELAELARMGSEQQSEVPIFVCTLAFPKLPCPLHVFEPRYRLMIRQVMEAGTRQFGMCMALGDDESSFCDYGTMLEIRDIQYFPDGRSVVDCIGGRRFRVKERSTRDGYNTAKVDFIKDEAPSNPQEEQALTELHEQVHTKASEWFLSIGGAPRAQIVRHFGTFPALEQEPVRQTHGPSWHWWLCAVLPLDPRAQTAIIAMSSLKARLQALQRVLAYVSRQRGGAGAGSTAQ